MGGPGRAGAVQIAVQTRRPSGAGQARYDGEYDPVYGLPRLAVLEWLARNPGPAESTTYEVEEWLAHVPALREEFDADVRDRFVNGASSD